MRRQPRASYAAPVHKLKCPRDAQPLTPAIIDASGVAVRAFECQECTGHWLEAEDLKEVEQSVEIHLSEWKHLPGVETQGQILVCPRCRQPRMLMDKVLSKRDHRVVMDVCSNCKGVWLDYGELEAIMRKGLFGALADVLGFLARS